MREERGVRSAPGPGRREVIRRMERAIRLISADHRERGQSGGRAGALYWVQSPSNEIGGWK